jgi:hypothetical protein
MVDNTIPTNQFHPYQPTDVTPHAERPAVGGLSSILKKAGLDTSRFGTGSNVNVRNSMDKARTYAQMNPGKVLGGLSALVIGLGMLRGRR